MQILEIKVSELNDFVTGNLWQHLTPKPITALRAISQAQNPRANPEDVALIIAFEKEMLLGLVGLLPDLIHGHSDQKIYSNSCWWAHPEKGKHLAVPLFLKAFSMAGRRMFMTDCTPHTMQILEKTMLFDFPETGMGIRGFLKFNLHEILPAKFPGTRKIKSFLKLCDQILNPIAGTFQKITSGKFLKTELKVERMDSFTSEMTSFIETHSADEFTRRSAADLKWIRLFPWIKKNSPDQHFSPVGYPFSYLTDDFKSYFLKVSDQEKLIGLLYLTVRDGHMKVPYVYFDDSNSDKVLQVIYSQAIQNNVTTLTIFNARLVAQMDRKTHPFLIKKKIRRMVSVAKNLSQDFQKFPVLQDGDGDVAFT
ncbi:MAG: hypothetical protein WAO52_04570 [Prolixibacteraceae bacterium]